MHLADELASAVRLDEVRQPKDDLAWSVSLPLKDGRQRFSGVVELYELMSCARC